MLRKIPQLLGSVFKVEKRIILIAFIVALMVLFYRSESDLSASSQQTYADPKRTAFVEASKKLTAGSNWTPKGYGSGEYLETIPRIKAGAVIDFDSGEVIWSQNLKNRISPASITKVATVMTALDIASKDKVISVSVKAAEQIPTKLGLEFGERLTLEEAIKASMLTSANDAAEAIADYLGSDIGDGSGAFMNLVNLKLEKIGALDSNFETPTGLDGNNHYSTVYDLAILAHEAKANYPFINQIASSEYIRLAPNGNHRLFDLPNWNALLGTYPGVDGLKIGYTENAGHVTAVTAEREGKKLIVIVIGAKSLEDREIAAATLLNYGFEKRGVEPYSVDDLDLVERFQDWKRQLTMLP
ncbi:MAG: hypothetical protein NUV69_03145 [Candidatus Curtissbacteria bacterium]|nr:hypothetical protein [Candidatus Curtissbacteria bacterium]